MATITPVDAAGSEVAAVPHDRLRFLERISATTAAWMSWKSSSFRPWPRPRVRSPTITTRAGAVARRQRARASERRQTAAVRCSHQGLSAAAEEIDASSSTSRGVAVPLASTQREQRRQLVGGQVAERAVVVVIETGELREENPERHGGNQREDRPRLQILRPGDAVAKTSAVAMSARASIHRRSESGYRSEPRQIRRRCEFAESENGRGGGPLQGLGHVLHNRCVLHVAGDYRSISRQQRRFDQAAVP